MSETGEYICNKCNKVFQNGCAHICDLKAIKSSDLTKRELFAAMAMQGLALKHGYEAGLAIDAVKYADALIKELENQGAKE